jgi:Ca-activated chloride channel family protein
VTISLRCAPVIAILLLSSVTAQNTQTTAAPPQSNTAASIGLIVDNSKSMLPSRKAVVEALKSLVETSNPSDEFFVVNFSDSPYLDQDFSADRGLIEKALEKPGIGRGTAFYDAVGDASVHLRQGARFKKHVLIVVSDGDDNESHVPSQRLFQELQQPVSPVVYCIVPVSPSSKGVRILDKIAKETGGKVYRAYKPGELARAVADLAQQIRNP